MRGERLRIALVSTPFVPVPPPRYGGTELVVSELEQGLREAGHEVVLFTTGDATAACDRRALFVRHLWPPSSRVERLHAAWAAAGIARDRHGFDLVHVHTSSPTAFQPLTARLPVVHTLHAAREDLPIDELSEAARTVRCVAISERQRATLPELCGVEVIHHGLDPSRYPEAREPGPALAFLGRLSSVKGPDVAAAVAAACGRELHVGGALHPDDPPEERRRIERALAGPHVRRLGELDHESKVALLSRSAALLFPIRWEEPFGLVMIEAMLCGCPVLALRGGAVDEVIDEGVTGFVARDEAHLAALVRDGVGRIDRGRVRARARERFSRRRLIDDHLRLYRAELAARVGRGRLAPGGSS